MAVDAPFNPAQANSVTVSLRGRLRDATHGLHARLNRHPMVAGVTRADFSAERYHQLLRGYYTLYQGLEAAIDAFLANNSIRFDYADRRKLPWLLADMAYFGLQPTAARLSLPVVDSVGALVGVLYAIEGSTLGGQVISRAIAGHHGWTAENGAAFFSGYGENTEAFWQEFIAFAESFSPDEAACLAAEAAACATFALFEQVLDEVSLQS